MNFKKFKAEILLRAKNSNACSGEYQRAQQSKDFAELIKVLTDNFNYASNYKIIDVELLEKVGAEICNKSNLFFNCDTNVGYLLASGSATVRAFDSATVWAFDSATVRASDSATVWAFDSATVWASGSATVRAFGSATVRASGSSYICSYSTIEHEVIQRAILRHYYTNQVILADKESLKS